MKKVIATTAAPGAIGPYSQAIDTGSFLYASGPTPPARLSLSASSPKAYL